ncbi:MAG: hypothetical protein IJ260_11175 [Butyrivibrio sp.]|nr:hypothetical protein [Butyrivibrio sp.]
MKKYGKLLITILISLIIWILCISFGGLGYQENDDTIMNMIAAGAYGEGSQYLICSGIIIGRLIKLLYGIFPGVNCYLWTFLVLNLISVIAISTVLSDEFGLPGTAIATVLVNLFFAKDFYIDLQFSKNAAMYGVVAFFLLLSFLYRGNKNVFRLLLSSFLLLISYSVRKEGFYFLLPFGFVALAVAMFRTYKESKSIRVFLPLLIPLFSALLSIGANFYAFTLDPDWKEYYDRDKILTDKRDFGNYNFDWNKEEYLEAGFTEWDFALLDMWYYNDVDNFSLDKIKKMEEIGQSTRIDRFRIETSLFAETFTIVKDSFQEGPLSTAAIVVTILTAIYCIRRKRFLELLGILVLAGGIFMECYYLACVRRALWRVEYGSWLAGALMMVGIAILPDMKDITDSVRYKITNARNGNRFKKVSLGVISAATLVMAFVWQGKVLDYSYDNYAHSGDGTYELFQKITKVDDKFFVVSIDDMFGGLCGARNIMEIDRRYAGLFHNVTAAGNYVIPAPNGMYYAHQRGITNVFGSLADRDDMYYIGGGERMGYILMYINEKYGPGISVREEEFDGFTAWKYFRTGT